jgi:hypothetical protein
MRGSTGKVCFQLVPLEDAKTILCTAFSSAINWNEWWLRPLLAFHVLLLLSVLIFRENSDFQTVVFFVICVSVVAAERINIVCSQNWQHFSTQNYFDDRGAFISVFYSAPLLLTALVQLVMSAFVSIYLTTH